MALFVTNRKRTKGKLQRQQLDKKIRNGIRKESENNFKTFIHVQLSFSVFETIFKTFMYLLYILVCFNVLQYLNKYVNTNFSND